jgi:FtsH-binding integral membrane protein
MSTESTPRHEERGAPAPARRPRRLGYVLLIAPFVGLLWVPFYNRIEPRAGAVPFFYWYQFAWIGISAVLTAVVYFATRRDDER